MNPTIQGYMDACHDAEDLIENIQISIANKRAELHQLETILVVAKATAARAKETLRVAASKEVIEEVTPRERDIAYMKGITMKVGDLLTKEEKLAMFAAPAWCIHRPT